VRPGATEPNPGTAVVAAGDRSRVVSTPADLADAVAALAK